MTLKDNINPAKIPAHIAIIMDGNGRWAKAKGLDRILGHKAGVKSVRDVTEAAAEIGVSNLTLYAFSTENWSRPIGEVTALMELLVETIKRELSTLNENGVKLSVLGNLADLPESCQTNLKEAMFATDGNHRMTLNLALSYSSRWEITKAVQRITADVKTGKLKEEQIDETLVNNYLNTTGIPDPELLIRTSGEMRISNFLLWQLAYSELYFTPTLWPDFGKEDFYAAIINYQKRERRFGRTSEQAKQL